ncbi:MAG: hypothetical protein UY56_C0028G0002 [Parcubacteria group bacterium GW2011_GWA1_50_14]|nr:MAG: hypothetical protein UY56_C0028G0002 [Parcubacteria group bacterium GW2011_GWA1_50_14]
MTLENQEQRLNSPEEEQSPEIIEQAKALDQKADEVAEQLENLDQENFLMKERPELSRKLEMAVYALTTAGFMYAAGQDGGVLGIAETAVAFWGIKKFLDTYKKFKQTQ